MIYGVPAGFQDPARYPFAHGGKDGHPFPVDRGSYDKSIALLSYAIRKAQINVKEKDIALRRLESSQIA